MLLLLLLHHHVCCPSTIRKCCHYPTTLIALSACVVSKHKGHCKLSNCCIIVEKVYLKNITKITPQFRSIINILFLIVFKVSFLEKLWVKMFFSTYQLAENKEVVLFSICSTTLFQELPKTFELYVQV